MTYLENYPNSITEGSGLISILSNMATTPWHELGLEEIKSLERMYGIRSGFKTINPVFELAPEESKANVILALYGEKWKRLWADFSLEYSQLDAYRVNESITRHRDDEDENETTFGRVIDENTTDDGTVTTDTTGSAGGTNSLYGFNSSLPVPSDVSSDTNTEKVEESRDLDTSTKTTNSGSDSFTRIKSEDETTTTTRSGNIGYTTPQELLRQDIELWGVPYFNIVFDDIDSFITLQIYSI